MLRLNSEMQADYVGMYATLPQINRTYAVALDGVRTRPQRGSRAVRVADIAIALAALLFIAPLLLTIAVLIALQDGGPVLFGHERVGRNGRSFRCLKFRSMVVDADGQLSRLLASNPDARLEWQAGHKLRQDPRTTALGRFLRRSSLDELPQLLNVLRGEMSIVGPRPIVAGEVVRYGRYIRHYFAVRPGITGLWQVSGRSNTSYRRRVACDVHFARRATVGGYIGILARTIPAVLTRTGSC